VQEDKKNKYRQQQEKNGLNLAMKKPIPY